MTQKHTPGPWHITSGQVYDREDIYCSESEGMIAQNARPEDARLIAAAPELLEALQYALGAIQYLCVHGKQYAKQDLPPEKVKMIEFAVENALAIVAKTQGN